MRFCCEDERGTCSTPGQIPCECCEGECARLGVCIREKARNEERERLARIRLMEAQAKALELRNEEEDR